MPAAFDEPAGLAYANGKLYVADTNNHAIRTIDLSHDNAVATLAIKGLEPPEPPKLDTKPRFPGAEDSRPGRGAAQAGRRQGSLASRAEAARGIQDQSRGAASLPGRVRSSQGTDWSRRAVQADRRGKTSRRPSTSSCRRPPPAAPIDSRFPWRTTTAKAAAKECARRAASSGRFRSAWPTTRPIRACACRTTCGKKRMKAEVMKADEGRSTFSFFHPSAFILHPLPSSSLPSSRSGRRGSPASARRPAPSARTSRRAHRR